MFVKQPKGARSGRPSPYEGRELLIAQEVADKLMLGVPLAVICREPGMPDYLTICHWRERFPDTVGKYIARAIEEGYEVLAAECLAIADNTTKDSIETEHGEIANTEWIQRSKVRIDTRLKLLAKWSKRYADNPQQTTVNVGVNVTQVSSEELTAIADRKQRILARLKDRT